MKHLVTTIYVFLVCSTLSSQENVKIIPTSPEAAALTKMVNHPVNMNTGVPDINIPLYEIQSGGLVLPIKLQYHAGGFKINEQASRAGLGWSLSSELLITRTVNGLDDLLGNYRGYMNNNLILPDGYKFSDGSPFSNANAYDLAVGNRDGQPDKFDYKLLDKSGSFFILKTGTSYKFVPIPYDNIKIEMTNDGLFFITDTDGTKYHFERRESTYTPDLVTTAWKCTKIINNLGKEAFSFTYTQRAPRTVRSKSDYIEYYSNEVIPSASFGNYNYSNKAPLKDQTQYNESYYSFHRLSNPKYIMHFSDDSQQSILYLPYYDTSTNALIDKKYTIVSQSSLNRNPFNSVTSVERYILTEIAFQGGKVKFDDNYQLNNMKILQGVDVVKTVSFCQNITKTHYMQLYQYHNGVENEGTPYLDSLIVTSGGKKVEKYSFLYNEKLCFGNHLTINDAWGYPTLYTTDNPYSIYCYSIPQFLTYEKHVLNIVGSYPPDVKEHIKYGTDNDRHWIQSSDKYRAGVGVLRRIIYPTGGYVDFDFEPNQYLCPMPLYVPNYYSVKNAFLAQYCGGVRIRSINYYDKGARKPTKQKYYKYGQFEEGTGELNVMPELNKNVKSYSSIILPMTEEYGYGPVMKEEYVAYIKKNPGAPVLNLNRSHYSTVMVDKKTSFFPASILDYTYENGSPIYYTKVTEYNSDMGVQTGKRVYEFYPPQYFDPLWHNRARVFDDAMIPYIKTSGILGVQKSISDYKFDGNKYQLLKKKSFEYEKYVYPEVIQVASAALNVLYHIVPESGGSYQTTDIMFYNNNYPAFTTMGEYRLAGYTIPVIKLLLKKESEEVFDSSPSLNKTVSYKYNRLQPSEITTVNSNGYIVKKTLKYSYDFDGIYDTMESKNMVSQVVEERHSLSDEHFYRKTNYNMDQNAGGIVPKSVEKSYNGGAVFIETTFDQYDQYGNLLQITGRDKIPTSYLWGYAGLYPVAQIRGVTYSQIPASFKDNPTILSPSTDDALRSVLSDLRSSINAGAVETYTYKRLIGMSSKTESNGSTTYFEYDDAGRLVSIKDNNKKTIESYEYKYTEPEAYAFASNRSNIPVLFTESVTGTSPVSYNKVLKGGLVDSNSSPDEISRQMIGLNMYSYSLSPDNSPQRVKLTLEGFYHPSAPSLDSRLVEIELYQNNQTMYSKTVRFCSVLETNPDNKEYLFVPPGDYTLVVKTPGSNLYSQTNMLFCYLAINTGSYSIVDNLSTISLVSGKEYKLKLVPPLYAK